MTQLRSVQITVSYCIDNDVRLTETVELEGNELYAFTRHLSKTRIVDIEDGAVRTMKNLHDTCQRICRGMP